MLSKQEILNYYSNSQIQKRILKFSKNREIAFMFDGYFSKRPQIIENLFDIKSAINKGCVSFHCSEERWTNPLLLKEKNRDMSETDKNRCGWDMIFDIDGVSFEYSKIFSNLIIKYLDSLFISNLSVKFSGNKGFHIGIPFEYFGNTTFMGEKIPRKNRFPEIPRKISEVVANEICEDFTKKLLELEGSIENICKKWDLNLVELFEPTNNEGFKVKLKKLWWLGLIEIDTILLCHRHLFRMPYSLNEKSGLVSIPINKNEVLNFKKEMAKIENLDLEKTEKNEFLNFNSSKNNKDTFMELLDKHKPSINLKNIEMEKKLLEGKIVFGDGNLSEELFEISGIIEEKDYPKTIEFILSNKNLEDGRKRTTFVLLTFLYSINLTHNKIEEIINNWNDNLKIPQKQNFLRAQLSWFKNLEKKISPPNFKNENYYFGIGIDTKIINEDINRFRIKSKNPLHQMYILTQNREREKMKKNKEERKKEGKKSKSKKNEKK